MVVLSHERCCGCGACVNICPKECINMVSDSEGFLFPEIDESKCVDCGLCRSVCSVLSNQYDDKIDANQSVSISHRSLREQPLQSALPTAAPLCGAASSCIPEAYGVKAKDIDLRLASSSGGFFSVIAKYILKDCGVVCGASMTDDCKGVKHIIIEKEDDLFKLRGSKYVQSDIGTIYKELLPILRSGRKVLFTGTPCQIDGFKDFLNKDFDNLICAEVICHGVPSPKLWNNYIDWQEAKTKAQIVKVDFRHKKCGWIVFGNRLENSQRKVLYSTLRDDPYLLMFLRDYCLRQSCYNCHAKNFSPRADFTLGDFWGIQNILPDFFDDKGVSLVLVHNEKAKKIFDILSSDMEFKKVDCMEALKGNICMLESVKRPKERDTFFKDMNTMSFKALSKKYAYVSPKQKLINLLEKYHLLKFARKIKGLINKLRK